jgi:hypothetical protein
VLKSNEENNLPIDIYEEEDVLVASIVGIFRMDKALTSTSNII